MKSKGTFPRIALRFALVALLSTTLLHTNTPAQEGHSTGAQPPQQPQSMGVSTGSAAVANERWGMGVAVGDYDNDGFADIYVGNFGTSRLYHNNGNGTFTDVAPKLGVARKGWSTGASFGDYDRDGRLDLFVPGYVSIDLNNLPPSP